MQGTAPRKKLLWSIKVTVLWALGLSLLGLVFLWIAQIKPMAAFAMLLILFLGGASSGVLIIYNTYIVWDRRRWRTHLVMWATCLLAVLGSMGLLFLFYYIVQALLGTQALPPRIADDILFFTFSCGLTIGSTAIGLFIVILYRSRKLRQTNNNNA